ncbi:hypothetical protein ACJX0J_035039, partial [Zea mays]
KQPQIGNPQIGNVFKFYSSAVCNKELIIMNIILQPLLLITSTHSPLVTCESQYTYIILLHQSPLICLDIALFQKVIWQEKRFVSPIKKENSVKHTAFLWDRLQARYRYTCVAYVRDQILMSRNNIIHSK